MPLAAKMFIVPRNSRQACTGAGNSQRCRQRAGLKAGRCHVRGQCHVGSAGCFICDESAKQSLRPAAERATDAEGRRGRQQQEQAANERRHFSHSAMHERALTARLQ